MGAAEEMSLDLFQRVYDVDVNGTFICSKAAFVPMARQKQGNIINIASMCGFTVLVPQKHASHNSAKAALIMLTKSWRWSGPRTASGLMRLPRVTFVIRPLRRCATRIRRLGSFGCRRFLWDGWANRRSWKGQLFS